MFHKLLFIMSTVLTVASALVVLLNKNIMHACIALLGSLIGIAGLYLTLGADFVAATQLMVYVGGVVILMLFAVMLTGGQDFVSKTQKLFDLTPNMGNATSYSVGIVSAALFGMIIYGLTESSLSSIPKKDIDPNLIEASTLERLGELLLTDHVLAFEISSVLLLGALVGAAIIARPDRSTSSSANTSEEQ
ncbi:NADH-quinone oxidoreductase subunit J [Bacteriovoracaceae bacterium]|nr:NADH-quinone oxidoreductase subunit J [Bacteriovoracaceae bacterium]